MRKAIAEKLHLGLLIPETGRPTRVLSQPWSSPCTPRQGRIPELLLLL